MRERVVRGRQHAPLNGAPERDTRQQRRLVGTARASRVLDDGAEDQQDGRVVQALASKLASGVVDRVPERRGRPLSAEQCVAYGAFQADARNTREPFCTREEVLILPSRHTRKLLASARRSLLSSVG